MAQAPLTVCANCSARVQDTEQTTCPRCLDPLSVKRFTSEEQLAHFREDRAAHGAPVPEEDTGPRRPGLALAFAFASGVMILAAVGISFSGIRSGSWGHGLYSAGQAIVPLAIGVALAAVAARYGGSGP